MKILFVTPSYFPIVGGSEVLTRTLATRLNEAGFHADIMTFNMNETWKPVWGEEAIQEGRFKVFKEPAFNPLPNLPNPLFNLLRINVVPKIGFVKKFANYDIIHFVGAHDLSFAISSIFVRKPKLLQFLGIFRRGGMYKYYAIDRPFMWAMLKRLTPKLADIFIIHSMEEKGLLLEMGLPEERIYVLRIGVDAEIFHPDEHMKTKNLLLFVGRIERIKGLHILMKALHYIGIPTNLVVIGPKCDPKYTNQIEKMIAAINRNGFHKVKLIGNLNQRELVKWYQKASVLVCPYLYETYSNVVRESLACGTPVVSTGSHMKNNSDGILLTSRDARDLANGVSRLLEDDEMRERFGRDGRKVIERYFRWESVTRELGQLYVNVLSRQRD